MEENLKFSVASIMKEANSMCAEWVKTINISAQMKKKGMKVIILKLKET